MPPVTVKFAVPKASPLQGLFMIPVIDEFKTSGSAIVTFTLVAQELSSIIFTV